MRLMLVVACVAVVMTCGCLRAPVVPPIGAVFTQFTAPLDTDINDTSVGSEAGKASQICVLGLVSFGDAGIQEAAEDGDLNSIDHADYKYLNVLFGLYQQYTTVVYGH